MNLKTDDKVILARLGYDTLTKRFTNVKIISEMGDVFEMGQLTETTELETVNFSPRVPLVGIKVNEIHTGDSYDIETITFLVNRCTNIDEYPMIKRYFLAKFDIEDIDDIKTDQQIADEYTHDWTNDWRPSPSG